MKWGKQGKTFSVFHKFVEGIVVASEEHDEWSENGTKVMNNSRDERV